MNTDEFNRCVIIIDCVTDARISLWYDPIQDVEFEPKAILMVGSSKVELHSEGIINGILGLART